MSLFFTKFIDCRLLSFFLILLLLFSVGLKSATAAAQTAKRKKVKLSYKEQRELDALPAKIEPLEKQHSQLLQTISDPTFYQDAPDHIAEALTAVTESEQELDRALERLIELEDWAGAH